jgi:glucan biosynthesis protein C
MTKRPGPSSRYHALDSLRAAMMFLGIYLHVVAAYSPNDERWFQPVETSGALDFTFMAIHVFRMPVFYVMAGFFTALLLHRYGFARTASNRTSRIVIPFVVGWIVVYPPTMLLCAWIGHGLPWALDFILSGRFLAHPIVLHLWFLEYLILLYLLAAIVVAAVRALVPAATRNAATRFFRSAVQSLWGPLPFAVLSFVVLLRMGYPGLEPPVLFMPKAKIVAAYAIPFAFGWLLYLNADLLDTLRRRAWIYTVVGAVAVVVYLAVFYSFPDRGVPFYVSRAANALAAWCFIFGLTGLFLRYVNGHGALGRYLCDSSYFLYIAHLPIILMFQLMLEQVPLSPLAKIPLILVATIALLLLLYRYAVRSTFIGSQLNGRTYPAAAAPAAAD